MMTQERKTNRMTMCRRIVASTFAAVVLSAGAVSTAATTQSDTQGTIADLRPPKPEPAAKPPIITSALLGALLSGVVIFVGLMPVKRSHQD